MLSFTINGDLRSRSNSAPVTHWLKEFYEESNIPSHGLRRRVSWIKVNTVGFRRLLGSNGTSIWRSGYLLWKLSPQAANTKMLPLTASLELSSVVSTDPGKLHSLICACKGSFFLQVHLLPAPFCLAGYVFAKTCYMLTDCPALSLSLCFPPWALSKGDLQAWKLWFEIFSEPVYLCTLGYQILASR